MHYTDYGITTTLETKRYISIKETLLFNFLCTFSLKPPNEVATIL